MRVRAATPADLPFVRACARQAYAPYLSRIGRPPAPMVADFEAARTNGQLWVADRNGTPVGYVVILDQDGELRVENVAVLPAVQGNGLGRRLLDWAEAMARSRGCAAVTLYTNAKMTENLAFYPKLGYRVTHRAVEDGFDRVFFRKELG